MQENTLNYYQTSYEKKEWTSYEKYLKRGFDFLLSFVLLILLSPTMLVVYLLIKRKMGGEVIFKQERIGLNGEPFILYKFRTMVHDAEDGGIPKLCQKDDSRLTPFGKFLREHHLDELPQLWNVFIGDMAFVGYRPERKYFIDLIMEENSDYRYLYQLRPGLFSEATLYNGYTDSMPKMIKRLEMDLEYLNNHSFWLDITIIFKTAVNIISGKKF